MVRFLKIAVILALFTAPFAYAQTNIFIGSKSGEDKKGRGAPTLFIKRNLDNDGSVFRQKKSDDQKTAMYKPYKIDGSLLQENQFEGDGLNAAQLDALMRNNMAPDFDVMRKESQKVRREIAQRYAMIEMEREKNKFNPHKKIAGKSGTVKTRAMKGNGQKKKKRQIYVKKRGGPKKPRRVFNLSR